MCECTPPSLSNPTKCNCRVRPRSIAIAFPFVSARYPHPSSTVNTIGFGRFVIARQNTRNHLPLSFRFLWFFLELRRTQLFWRVRIGTCPLVQLSHSSPLAWGKQRRNLQPL